MPLEQIRPVLRLDPEKPRRYSSLLDSDDESPTHTPEDDDRRHDWHSGPSSLRRTASLRKAEEMSLAKLGGVGGVTRSGSWNRGPIGGSETASSAGSEASASPGHRVGKLYRSPQALSEEDGTDHEADVAFCSRETNRRKPASIGGSTTSEPRSSSSRTSTSSSSAAAFSLRSLSNRNSTGSVSSTASSTGSLGGSSALRTHTPESSSIASPGTQLESVGDGEAEAIRSHSVVAVEDLKTDCDSVSDSTDVPPSDSATQCSEATAAAAESEGVGLINLSPAASQAEAPTTPPTQSVTLASMDGLVSTTSTQAPDSTPQTAAAPSSHALDQTPTARPFAVLRVPSREALQEAEPASTIDTSQAPEHVQYGSGEDVALRPPVPRRHSGRFMLRSRSQLASHPGLQMSFANGGQGRAAARDRSRQPTSYDNAPFSVLEARRRAETQDEVAQPSSPRLAAVGDWARRKSGSATNRLVGLTPLARQDQPSLTESASSIKGDFSAAALASSSVLSKSSPDCSPSQASGSAKRNGPLSAAAVTGPRPTLSRTPSIQGTNVFRTPTMEEWSRFLESQGVTIPTGRHSRTATNFSAASAQQLASRLGSSSFAPSSAGRAEQDSDDGFSSDDSDDELAAGVLEKLRQIGLSRAASRAGSVLGEDLASLRETEEEDLASPNKMSTSASDPLSLFMPTLGSRRGSPLPSPGLERSPIGSPSCENTTQMMRERGQSLRSPSGQRQEAEDTAASAETCYDHGEQSRKTIDDFVILSEVGRGAYGLVKRARAKDADGNATGDEVIIKYIIKSRILADCWRRHRSLGPIPIEIHVMDQLRRLPYHPPPAPVPWSPYRPRSIEEYRHRSDVGRNTEHVRGAAEGELAPAQDADKSRSERSQTSHPNLCTMLEFFEDYEFYYLVMPRYGTGQDLFDYVESAPEGLATFEIRSILGQVADALRFLHFNNIVHRDIKDENVILDGDGNAQLIDFGSAAHVRPGRLFDTFSGTLDYAAAEILRGEKYAGQAQDVWALGVVGFVLLCGECPFWNGEEAIEGLVEGSRAEQTLHERKVLAQTSDAKNGSGPADDDDETSVDPATWKGTRKKHQAEPDGGGRIDDVVDLISRCLEVDPSRRPTAAQICEHRFLAGQGGWTGPLGWMSGSVDSSEALSPMPA